jgi:beta-lactamase class A
MLCVIATSSLHAQASSRPCSTKMRNRWGGTPSAEVRATITHLAAQTDGLLALNAVDLQTGRAIAFNAHCPAFMSSVVKLALAVHLLREVDRRRLNLDSIITVGPRDLREGASGITDSFPHGGVFTVRELLRRGVSESDNTASDALLRLGRGPGAVTASLRAAGVNDLAVTHSYAASTLVYGGVRRWPPEPAWTPAMFDSLRASVPEPERRRAQEAFLKKRWNPATPEALTDLLTSLARGHTLSDSSWSILRHFMTDTRNPVTRIVAGAPAESIVAHKSGSWGTVGGVHVALNDAGIIKMAEGGEIVLAVMISGAHGTTVPHLEAIIAQATTIVVAALRAKGGTAR